MKSALTLCVCIWLAGTESRAIAAPTVSIGTISATANGMVITLTIPVSIQGGAANTDYWYTVVAIKGKDTISLSAGTRIMTLADGTANGTYQTNNGAIKPSTTYTFKVTLYPTSCDAMAGTNAISNDSKDFTTPAAGSE